MPKPRTVWYLVFAAYSVAGTAAVVAINSWGAGVMAGASLLLLLLMFYQNRDPSHRRIVFDKQKRRLFIGDVVKGQDTFRSGTQAAEQIPIGDIRALELLQGGYGVDAWAELNVVRRDERRVHLYASNDAGSVESAAHKIGEVFNLPVTSERAE